MPLLLAVPAAVLAIGLALAWAGGRGRRVGDHPTCRRCGYDLSGRPDAGGVCPECGASLDADRAVRVGRVVRRPGVFAAGAVLSLLGAGLLSSSTVRNAARDPAPWKPSWLLVREAAGRDTDARLDAFNELEARFAAGRLDTATLKSIVSAVLFIQGRAGEQWHPDWGRWVERARRDGHVTDEQWQRYLRQATVGWYSSVRVRERVRRGDPFPIDVVYGRPRVSREAAFDVECVSEVSFDDQPARVPLRMGSIELSAFPPQHGSAMLHGKMPFDALADGPHRVFLHLTLRVFDDSSPRRVPAAEVPVRLEAPWRLLPEDESSLELVNDESYRAGVERSISELYVGLPPGRPDRASVGFRANKPPIDCVYHATLRAGGKEWPVGVIHLSAGWNVPHGTGEWPVGAGLGARDRVDLVLRPDAAAAVRTTSVVRMWNREIVIRDVPLRRYPARNPTDEERRVTPTP